MNINTIEDLLKKNSFFGNLPDDDLKLIAGCGSNRVVLEDEVIAREGEEANLFYLIRKGKLAIETHMPNKGNSPIQTLGTGDVAGWSWLFPPYRWNFDVRALEETHLLCLDGSCLRSKCEANHSLGYRLITLFAQLITKRNRALRLQVMDVYGRSEDS